jgi:hypothetical protein
VNIGLKSSPHQGLSDDVCHEAIAYVLNAGFGLRKFPLYVINCLFGKKRKGK